MSLAGENALEDVLPLLTWTHMDTHVVGVLAEEKYMVAEYECHLPVELKDAVKASEQKSTEGTEFLLVFEYHFVAVDPYMMVGSQHLYESVYVKILRILRSLIVFLVDLLYDAICYHGVYVFIVFVLSVIISN